MITEAQNLDIFDDWNGVPNFRVGEEGMGF